MPRCKILDLDKFRRNKNRKNTKREILTFLGRIIIYFNVNVAVGYYEND